MARLLVQAISIGLLWMETCNGFSISSTVASSMVLQHGVPLSALWGLATPGAEVTATFSASGVSYNGTTDPTGVWRVAVPPLPVSTTPQNITFSTPGEAVIIIDDILVGDVLLCRCSMNRQGC